MIPAKTLARAQCPALLALILGLVLPPGALAHDPAPSGPLCHHGAGTNDGGSGSNPPDARPGEGEGGCA